MSHPNERIRTDIAWSDQETITVRDLDLCTEILGLMDLGEFSFLQLTGRRPSNGEAAVYNAMLVAMVEHGMTPSALVARMTYLGAPESIQAAIAAGLCGVGSVFLGSMEGMAQLLSRALPRDVQKSDGELRDLAAAVVVDHHAEGLAIPGIGHRIHKHGDPRAARLFSIAKEGDVYGPYLTLARFIADEATRRSGRPLPLNVTGTVGALCCELDLDPNIVRGVGVIARAVGLLGHLAEEARSPLAREVWRYAEVEATAHRGTEQV